MKNFYNWAGVCSISMPGLKRQLAAYAGKAAGRYAIKKFRAASKGYVAGGRRKSSGKRGRFARAVKRVIFSTAEKCYKSKQVDGTSATHDSLTGITVWNPSGLTLFPSQGNGDGERRGDEIYATGIMIRAVFQIPYDRRNMKFKMWFLQYDPDQTGDPTKANFFHNVSNNVIVDPVQSDRWKGCVRYLGQYHCFATDQSPTGQDKTIIVKKWIPLKRKITFKDDTSTLPCNGVKSHGALVLAPYDTITSTTMDVLITNSEITFTLYYKDP